jgi:MYXO-CTERM domain-containing protein
MHTPPSRLALALTAAALCASPTASAFCGFYVAGSDATLSNRATSVVLLRDGARTVLSMQNTYEGPPEDFALVVPVPIVLQRENVRTLPREVFDRVDRLAAPRLVEYWEQDPCRQDLDEGGGGLGSLRAMGRGVGQGYGSGAGGLGVTVEAQFAVGEYDVVVLSATDSAGLETWLTQNRYRIPAGAAPILAPYVRGGSKFFVARVDAARVHFERGRALLSPLRVHYDSDSFSLPIRLGLLNSPGRQDLIVHTLGRSQRYEAANRPNVYAPTNLDAREPVRDRFGDFYNALFDRTMARTPGAVVTEYAWQTTSCDPCPVDPLSESELLTLGADVAPSVGNRYAEAPVVRVVPRVAAGGLAPEMLRRVAQRNLGQVAFCYERSFAAPIARGTVEVRFATDASGAVTASDAVGGSYTVETVRACIANAMRRWRFPESATGPSTSTLTFDLNTGPASLYGRSRFGASGVGSDWVLTRLHTRYGRDDVGEDLVFRAAPPVTGGREVYTAARALEETARSADINNFQTRVAIRHPWTGPVACANPRRGQWGGPPDGAEPPTRSAQHLAFAAPISLDAMLVPPRPAAPPPAPAVAAPAAAPVAPPVARPAARTRSQSGLRCASTPGAPARAPYGLALAALAALGLRRRATPRAR